MDRLNIAGLWLDPVTKQQLLEQIDQRISRGGKTFLTTVYSEFLLASMKDRGVRDLLNRADLAVADGVALPLAERFLSQPFLASAYKGRIIEAWLQLFRLCFQVLWSPQKIYHSIPAKIVGADLIWDLAELAQRQSYSIFLLGGFDDTPEQVQHQLKQRYPYLNIVGVGTTGPEDPRTIEMIKLTKPDMLLVAYGPLRQEGFIDAHLTNLPVKFAVGLGGTFDYVAGKRWVPPVWVRYAGLEWLFRLFTQPKRIKRIANAVVGLLVHLVRYKVLQSMPFRPNAVAVAVNAEGKVLLCQRNPKARKNSGRTDPFVDYWQFPQGGIDINEDIVTGAARELQEETGITSISVIGISKHQNQYDWPNANRPILWQNFQFRGQEQRTVFFQFNGTDKEIELDKTELVNYRWCGLDEAKTLVASERKAHATAVLTELQALMSR